MWIGLDLTDVVVLCEICCVWKLLGNLIIDLQSLLYLILSYVPQITALWDGCGPQAFSLTRVTTSVGYNIYKFNIFVRNCRQGAYNKKCDIMGNLEILQIQF